MMVDLQAKFTWMVGQLIRFAYTLDGYQLTFGDAYRSSDSLPCPSCAMQHSYQDLLVHAGRSMSKNSLHLDRLAVDFNVFVDGNPAKPEEFRPLGEYWESLEPNLAQWGGRFGVPEAERPHKIGWDAGHFGLRRALQGVSV